MAYSLLAATLFAIFIIPVTFYVVEKLSGSKPGSEGSDAGPAKMSKGKA